MCMLCCVYVGGCVGVCCVHVTATARVCIQSRAFCEGARASLLC